MYSVYFFTVKVKNMAWFIYDLLWTPIDRGAISPLLFYMFLLDKILRQLWDHQFLNRTLPCNKPAIQRLYCPIVIRSERLKESVLSSCLTNGIASPAASSALTWNDTALVP